MEDVSAQILNDNKETDIKKEVVESVQTQKNNPKSHPVSLETSQGVESPYGELDMEAAMSSDDVIRAGGFGARDDISSFLPVASDSTDFEASLLDARSYEDPQKEINRPGLGYTK